MNIKKSIGRNIGWILICFFFSLFLITCKKDDPTRAVVTVLDVNKSPVPGATVTLWQDTAVNASNGVKSTIRVIKISDAGGNAQFDFELEAFLNIEVVSGPDTGRSFIRLKEHETVTATVNL